MAQTEQAHMELTAAIQSLRDSRVPPPPAMSSDRAEPRAPYGADYDPTSIHNQKNMLVNSYPPPLCISYAKVPN